MSTQFPSNSPQQLVGIAIKTGDYNVMLSDNAWLLIMSSSSSHTFTLLATPPTRNGWFVYFRNLGTGVCTIARNGNNIDGTAANITLNQGDGILLGSDGTTYYTVRGQLSNTAVTSVFGRTGAVTAQSGDYTVGQVTGAEDTANKDAASGYAGLDSNTMLKAAEQQETVDARTTTTEAITSTSRGKVVTFSNSSAVAASIAQAGTASLIAGWWADLENLNSGAVTLTPTTSTINGNSTLILQKGEGGRLISDGTNYVFVSMITSKDQANGYAGLDVNTMLKVAEQQETIDARTTTSEAVASASRGKVVTFSNTAAVAATIAQAGTASLITGWWADLVNLNTGIVTLTPTTSTINGASTLVLQKGQGGRLLSDGSNYIFIAGQPTTDTPNDADVLTYVLADKRWEAKAISTLGGANASQIRGKNISSATPTDQQVLKWSATDNQYDLVYADGLLHGDSVWDVDPVVYKLYDDFDGGSNTSTDQGKFGQTNWTSLNGAAYTPVYYTGAPPHFGIFAIPMPTSAGQGNGITRMSSNGSSNNMLSASPLLDYPGWKMEWVWRWGYTTTAIATLTENAAISSSSKLCSYIGMANCALLGSGNSLSRPYTFIGLRFDTDGGAQQTNSSGAFDLPNLQISDTTMKFEVVNNIIDGNARRDNFQGIRIVQKTTANSASVASNGTLTASFNSAIGQNNMIAVLVAVGGTTAPSVTDTPGTTYTKNATQNDAGSAFSVHIFSGTTSGTPVTSSTNTITVKNNNAGAQSMAFWAYEIMSTQGGALSFDASVGANGTSTSPTTGSIANAGQDELLFEVTGVGTTSEAVSNAAGSGWLLDTSVTGLTTGLFSAGSSMRQTNLDTTPTGTSTIAASKPWALLVGSFKTTVSSFFDTGVAPTVGQWYRLELKCVAAGQVQVTLYSNNSQIAQHTFTVSQQTYGTSVANSGTAQASGTFGHWSPALVPAINNGAGPIRLPYGSGSVVTLAGLTGAGPSTLNGTHALLTGIEGQSFGTAVSFYSSVSSFGSTTTKGTIAGYSAYSPMVFFGAPAISTGITTDFQLEVDMFKFVWDTSLAGSPLALGANYSRYVATPADTGQ